MKLSNYQVNAIVSTVISRQRKIREKQISDFRKDPKHAQLAEKALALIEKMPEKIAKRFRSRFSKEELIHVLCEDYKPSQVVCEKSELENKLHVASIESKNLAELKLKFGYDF